MTADPTDDKPDHWANDLLDRRADSAFLRDFLVRRIEERKAREQRGSYVLNIDAKWGFGKSFFLERFKKDLEADYTVVYVNAWASDYADDPLLAVMVALESVLVVGKTKTLQDTLQKLKNASGAVAVTSIKHLAIHTAKRFIGPDGAEAVSESLDSSIETSAEDAAEEIIGRHAEAAIKGFEIAKKSVDEFKRNLSKLVASKKVRRPLFVLIDELDRCRPSYAITLLERVKHLFDVEDVAFVIATDTEQLRHAVGAVYGSGFDGAGYLLRFFDRRYEFAEASTARLVASFFEANAVQSECLSSPGDDNHIEYVASFAQAINLSAREIERCIELVSSAVTVWPYKGRVRLELAFLMPLIVAHVRRDDVLFQSLRRYDGTELQRRLSGTSVLFKLPPEEFPEPTTPKVGGLFEFSSALLDAAKSDIMNFVNNTRGKGVRAWARERLLEEYQAIHANRPTAELNHQSVLTRYPEAIRSVGRLSGRG